MADTSQQSRQTATRRRIPPVAVIGCGYWGKNLVRNFYHLGALAMVCDSTEAGRTA
ncbi:MAG: oxidoreductase, partial [Roseiflexus castenholzii]